jgi:hypothetical protein
MESTFALLRISRKTKLNESIRMRPGKYTVDEVRMPRLGYLLSLAA